MSKVIIAGSRSINNEHLIKRAIEECGFTIEEIVSGCAEGVDTTASKWAKRNHIPLKEMPADWEGHPERHITKNGRTYDPLAGHERNKAMAEYADAAVIIWDGVSTGSKNMIYQMKSLGKPVRILQRVSQDRSETPPTEMKGL